MSKMTAMGWRSTTTVAADMAVTTVSLAQKRAQPAHQVHQGCFRAQAPAKNQRSQDRDLSVGQMLVVEAPCFPKPGQRLFERRGMISQIPLAKPHQESTYGTDHQRIEGELMIW
jgi:hypothetical protein